MEKNMETITVEQGIKVRVVVSYLKKGTIGVI